MPSEIDKRNIRGELVRLKTDVEDHISPNDPAQIGFEVDFHRASVEKAMSDMELCSLESVFDTLRTMRFSESFIMRYDDHNRIPKIEEMLIDKLIEIASENCQCRFQKKEA